MENGTPGQEAGREKGPSPWADVLIRAGIALAGILAGLAERGWRL